MAHRHRTSFDRRRSPRMPTEAFAYLALAGQRPRRCHVTNQSASGVFLRGHLPLLKGLAVEVVFVSREPTVTRLDRRQAIVMHVSASGAGVLLYHPGLPRLGRKHTH